MVDLDILVEIMHCLAAVHLRFVLLLLITITICVSLKCFHFGSPFEVLMS